MDAVQIINGEAFVSVSLLNKEIDFMKSLLPHATLQIVQDEINSLVASYFDLIGA